jgi:hypothetical protein
LLIIDSLVVIDKHFFPCLKDFQLAFNLCTSQSELIVHLKSSSNDKIQIWKMNPFELIFEQTLDQDSIMLHSSTSTETKQIIAVDRDLFLCQIMEISASTAESTIEFLLAKHKFQDAILLAKSEKIPTEVGSLTFIKLTI